MRICIFHNLKKGGALLYLQKLAEELNKNHNIYVYSFQKNDNLSFVKKYYYLNIKKTKNLYQHLNQVLFELKNKSKKIAYDINRKKYDLILVNNDYLTQSPYILKYLKKTKHTKIFYISHEPKREFYEKTTFDHMKLRRLISRISRYYIKTIDKINCKKAPYIITNSFYSQHIFKKIYNKESYVIHPGFLRTPLNTIMQKNNHNYISFSDFSRLKGHHISITFFKKINNAKLILAGRKNNDYDHIYQSTKDNKRIAINLDLNNEEKNILLNSNSIFLCNQINEPFGITTMEIVNKNKFVIGLNNGGTSEIVNHGINGLISSEKELLKILKYINKKRNIIFYNNAKISWKNTTNKLLSLYHFLKNEPAY